LKEQGTYRIQDVMVQLAEAFPEKEAPTEKAVSNFIRNYRSRILQETIMDMSRPILEFNVFSNMYI